MFATVGRLMCFASGARLLSLHISDLHSQRVMHII